jgi:hypothetical protein
MSVKLEEYTSISVDKDGRIVGHNRFYLNKVDLDNAKKVLEDAEQNQLVDGEKVFFTSSSSIPRYKFAEYGNDHDISKVIKISRASAIILNPDTIISGCVGYRDYHPHYVYPKDVFTGHTNHGWTDKVIVHATVDLYKKLDTALGIEMKKVPAKGKLELYEYGDMSNENLDRLDEILTSGKKILVDKTVAATINIGVGISDEVFEELNKMLQSKDFNNVSLAMEIMANSDYYNSEFKLARLLYKNLNKIAQCSTYNYKNFKGLREYMKNYDYSNGVIKFAESIIKTTRDDMEDKEERLSRAINSVKAYLDLQVKDTIFSVKELSIA